MPVSVKERVAVMIWKLATNVVYHTLSSLFGLGRSTVGKIAVETCRAIATHLLLQYVQIPSGEKFKEIVDCLETFLGFPQAAGAIDGSHIPKIRPEESASDYYNRKGITPSLYKSWWIIWDFLWTYVLVGLERYMMPAFLPTRFFITGGELLRFSQIGRELFVE